MREGGAKASACGILVPQPGIESKPSTVKVQGPDHLNTREYPHIKVFIIFHNFFSCQQKDFWTGWFFSAFSNQNSEWLQNIAPAVSGWQDTVFLLPPLFIQFSGSFVSNSLRLHGLQHARLPCPSPALGACSNSCPSGR